MQVSYDLLVGADGSRSAVRSALQQIMPGTYIQRYRHGQVYCSGPVTGCIDGEVTKHTSFEAHPLLKVCTRKSCYLAMPVRHAGC
jgi:2-polyprenyl-6-methoxyphenol hydroxylase-like FAD-dependent oxidoreductase